MTTQNLNFGTDSQGRNAFTKNVSNLIYRAKLSQNTASSITLPTETGISNYEVFLVILKVQTFGLIIQVHLQLFRIMQHLQLAILNSILTKEYFHQEPHLA